VSRIVGGQGVQSVHTVDTVESTPNPPPLTPPGESRDETSFLINPLLSPRTSVEAEQANPVMMLAEPDSPRATVAVLYYSTLRYLRGGSVSSCLTAAKTPTGRNRESSGTSTGRRRIPGLERRPADGRLRRTVYCTVHLCVAMEIGDGRGRFPHSAAPDLPTMLLLTEL
jgi:hypothetical protein